MREILFRGKRIDNGEWAYGYYYYDAPYDEHIITFNDFSGGGGHVEPLYLMKVVVVDPETVCQFTGMTDRNGNKIFEGDKVAFVDFLNGWETECIGEVVFLEYGWGLTNSITESNMYSYEPDDIEIIGNIHDGV